MNWLKKLFPDRRVHSPNRKDQYVVSYGGSGSKLLLNFLQPDADKDELKRLQLHSRNLRAYGGKNDEFIYVFADPRNAVLSFFQRRQSRHERHGFSQSNPVHLSKEKKKWVTSHAVNLGLSASTIPEDWDIEEFLEHSKSDPLQLAAHFQKWWRFAENEDVTFIRYEKIWQHEKLLKSVFDLPHSQLPALHPRRADWSSQPQEIADGLTRLYAPLLRQFERYPDVFTRNKVGTPGVNCPINEQRRVIVGPGTGMFAITNAVVNMFNQYDQGKIPSFRIDDENFLFGKWSDFFQHPFEPTTDEQAIPFNRYTQEFVQPRRPISAQEAGNFQIKGKSASWASILLPPEDREAAHRIISKYLVLEASLDAQVQREIKEAEIKNCLALHIRGPGRLHGGVDWMLSKLGYSDVPFAEYFKYVDAFIAKHDVDIFIFSDAIDVIKRVQEKYGDRVKFRSASLLAEKGEGHLDDSLADKTKLGKDIIIECYLMANAKHLIHGNSNVTNFALCANPSLSHQDIFQDIYFPPAT